MRIAIATQDLARVDAHLGWARFLMIYEVSEEGYRYLETASFETGQQDGNEAKLIPRIEAVKGCNLVFVADVGPEGEGRLAQTKVVPVRKFAGQPVAAALDALRDSMRNRTTPWLRQAERQYRREQREE